jgi:hypothetical protein
MLGKLVETLVQKGVEKAAEHAVESTFEYNSVTVTNDWLDGPKNNLPPLFSFLPNNTMGKWWCAGIGILGFAYFAIAHHFMCGVLWGGMVYGVYAILFGGAVFQSPPGFSVPKVYHLLGWKARVAGIILVVLFGGILAAAMSEVK